MVIDSRKLRFYGCDDTGNNILFDEDWDVTTAASTTDQPLLSLARAGLEDAFDDCNDRNISDSTNYRQSIAVSGNNQEDSTASSPYYYQQQQNPPKRGYGPYIALSPEERELFMLIRKAREELNLSTTLRIAGGLVFCYLIT